MKKQIDINCDLGEGFGIYHFSDDSAILQQVSSCNIACGFHAGDPSIISATIRTAIANGVKIGAHPSYPDLQGFGRRTMRLTDQQLYDSVLYQVSAIYAMSQSLGGKMTHVKLHGALYNDSSRDLHLAKTSFKAIRDLDPHLIVYGLPGSEHEEAANTIGIEFYPEAFADRKYTSNGLLADRKMPGSLIEDPDEVAAQAVSIVNGQAVETMDGGVIPVIAKTICVHGDHPDILRNLKAMADRFNREHIAII